ncbi:MAG: toll/interleukin-1 receptor domain-containing protein, partial [bacterium]
GMLLREVEEGRGELTLFFDSMASEETRFQFEEFVYTHLQRRALPESIHRRCIFVCSGCGLVVTDQLVRLRAERGFTWADCPVCQRHISLLDREERLAVVHLTTVLEMDRTADAERERETKASVLQGKIATNDFDVFIAYNNVDKPVVKQIAERLKERGILPWLDEWNLPPGRMAQQEIERILPNIKAVAIFVGPSGIGPWENVEMHAAITQFVKRKLPVITVLLPGVATEPDLPLFLKEFKWVWFTSGIDEPKALDDLEWGITGENPQKSKRY